MTGKIKKRNLFVSAFALLTVSAMSLFFSLYEPWMPIGPELIPDGSFSTPAATNAWSGWGERTRLVSNGGFGGSPGVVLTTSSNQNGVLRFTVHNLTNIPAFRASLRATAQGVVRGKEGYYLPRALFYYHDSKAKALYGIHHGIMDISEDTGWRYYKDFFPVPKGAIDARLHIQNQGVAGVMQIDDVSVIPVRERHSTPWWKLFFGTLWMTAFGLCLFILRPWARRHGVLILITLALIMIGIVLPGKVLDGAIEKSIHTAKGLMPKPAKPMPPAQTVKAAAAPDQPAAPKPVKPKEEPAILFVGTGVDNTHLIGHFAMFSLLAFLSALSWLAVPPSLKRTACVFAGLTFFAAATEVLQYIPSDRAAALSDLRVDTVGMAGTVVLVFAIRHLQRLITRV